MSSRRLVCDGRHRYRLKRGGQWAGMGAWGRRRGEKFIIRYLLIKRGTGTKLGRLAMLSFPVQQEIVCGAQPIAAALIPPPSPRSFIIKASAACQSGCSCSPCFTVEAGVGVGNIAALYTRAPISSSSSEILPRFPLPPLGINKAKLESKKMIYCSTLKDAVQCLPS